MFRTSDGCFLLFFFCLFCILIRIDEINQESVCDENTVFLQIYFTFSSTTISVCKVCTCMALFGVSRTKITFSVKKSRKKKLIGACWY